MGKSEDIMERMNESLSHSSFFIATAWQNKDFQISLGFEFLYVFTTIDFYKLFKLIGDIKQ
jgi:hypothetical protein